DCFDPRFQLFEKFVVNPLIDDGARAGRALLALEAERGLGDALNGGVDIGVRVDDDGVLATHFQNRALDPDLAGSLRGRGFIDVQSYFARPSEGDVASLGMRHDGVAKAGARPGQEVNTASGRPPFSGS